jgi:periplasmic protein TonB
MTHAIAHFLKSSLLACTLSTALWLTGCSTPPPRPSQTMASPPTPAPAPAPVKPAAPIALPSAPVKPQLPTSNARSAKEYRVDAAKHLYKLNGARIFKGRMPPMLYAVGVLDVEVDKQGQVTRTYWVRAPGHAPEVMREIEKTVRLAAPYPVPAHLGKVVYSDVWLWHKSGHFQLDTLTEGQD